MQKRYALIYSDGSMNVHTGNMDLLKARKELGESGDDPDTELVEIEFKVVKVFGPKGLPAKHDPSVTCPVCQTEIDVPASGSER